MVALLYYVHQSKPGSLLTTDIYRQDFQRSRGLSKLVLSFSRKLRLVTACVPDFDGDIVFIRGDGWNNDVRNKEVTPDELRHVFEAMLFGTPGEGFPKAFGPITL